MRCVHCDCNPVTFHMTVAGGQQVTLESCCTPRWFHEGQPVALAAVLASVPRRAPRRPRRRSIANALAA